MKHWIPAGAMFGHGVEYGEQLAHTGHEGDLLTLARGKQALVVNFHQDRIVAYGPPAGHVQGAAHVGASTPRSSAGHASCRSRGSAAPRPPGQRCGAGRACPARVAASSTATLADAGYAGQQAGQFSVMVFDIGGDFGVRCVSPAHGSRTRAGASTHADAIEN